MILINLLSIQLLLSASLIQGENCALINPPKTAGETQAHGMILYIYPRSHTIDKNYTGCQSQWFLDENHYRKLSVVHYRGGIQTKYDNINLRGDIGYHCEYKLKKLVDSNDKRCPQYETLKKKTYQAGCYSLSKLNSSNSYDVSSKECLFE
jgi:hypothetical protein